MTYKYETDILKEYDGILPNNLNNLLSSQDIDDDINLTSFSPYLICGTVAGLYFPDSR